MKNMKIVLILSVLAAFLTGCYKGDSSSSPSDGGSRGGSMARFAISGDWLYTVNESSLTVVSVKTPSQPADGDRLYIGGGIETIFPMDTLLFIGSQSGMHIYDIKQPEFPKHLSTTTHFRSCDPVAACDTLAFVTLNSATGWWCGQNGNELQVYDIRDLSYPKLLSRHTENLTSPRGLAVDGDLKLVFVCDSGSGIKAFDFTDPRDVRPLYTSLTTEGVGRIDAYDCIMLDGRLLVIGSDGLYQLEYNRDGFTRLVSKIDLRKE